LLLGLAAHNRGFEFVELADGVVLHPAAWLEVLNVGLQQELMALLTILTILKKTNFIIEQQQERFFRLSVQPDNVYFDEQWFCFSVQQADLESEGKIPVSITRAEIVTALGITTAKTETFDITSRLAKDLQRLSLNTAGNAAHWIKDNCRHTELGLSGLKRLFCQENGEARFCVAYQVI
jgi:hypothetical protein